MGKIVLGIVLLVIFLAIVGFILSMEYPLLLLIVFIVALLLFAGAHLYYRDK